MSVMCEVLEVKQNTGGWEKTVIMLEQRRPLILRSRSVFEIRGASSRVLINYGTWKIKSSELKGRRDVNSLSNLFTRWCRTVAPPPEAVNWSNSWPFKEFWYHLLFCWFPSWLLKGHVECFQLFSVTLGSDHVDVHSRVIFFFPVRFGFKCFPDIYLHSGKHGDKAPNMANSDNMMLDHSRWSRRFPRGRWSGDHMRFIYLFCCFKMCI